MRRSITALLSLSIAAISILPIKAQANVQIASMVDWGGLSISANSGFSQTITLLSVPEPSKANVEWGLNVGNGTGRISPMIILSNRQEIRFGFVFVSSDVRFKQSGSTVCNVSSPNMFGEVGTYQANCTTPVKIIAGQSYTVTFAPENPGSANSWVAEVLINNTGEKINLGVISFSVPSAILNASLANDGFNQTSIYGSDLNCKNAPSAEVIYAKPVAIGTPLTPVLVKTRASSQCPEFGFTKQNNDAVRVKLGNGNPVEPSVQSDQSYHQGADYYLNFVPTRLDLNESLEMDFTPLTLSLGEKGGRGSYYGFDWCWQTKDSLKGELACGSFHIEAYGESGNGLVANADFFFQHASATSKIDSETNCELRMARKIAGENSNYTTCARRVIIQPDRTYTLSVISTWRGQTYGNVGNWWKATMTDKQTGASVDIGYIKGVANLYELPLASMHIGFSFEGKPSLCNQVPINDTIYGSLRSGTGVKATLKSDRTGNCAQVKIGRLNDDPTKFMVNHGGADAASRNISKFSTISLYGNPSQSNSSTTTNKPSTPKLTLLNVTGNEVNIDVNLGNAAKPDTVFLIAPNLAGNSNGKIPGTISGNSARWKIPLSKDLSGALIPIKIISESKGVESDALDSEFQVPIINAPASIQKAPISPKSPKSNFLGTDLLISAQIETSGNAVPEEGFIIIPGMGITKNKPLAGEIIGNKLVFSVPVKSKNLGQQYEYKIFTRNQIGDSKSVQAKAKIPRPASIPKVTQPKAEAKTISCLKGTVLRTFLAKTCPPGWKQS